jgi:hypothetical protein
VASTETEVYRAFEGAPSAPNFYNLKKSLDGANAYDVYSTELSEGLDASLSYSTFPTGSTTITSTATNATSVLVASYPASVAAAGQAAAASALVIA